MNDLFAAPSASATATNLWDRYVGLPPVPKLILRLKSLIVTFTSKTDFVACLQATKIRPPEGTAWRATAVTLELEALRAAKLLTEAYTCPNSLLHRVAEDAMASPDAPALATAIRNASSLEKPGWGHYPSPSETAEVVHRLIRLSVYANDETGFIANRQLSDTTLGPNCTMLFLMAHFAAVPLATAWIASRLPPIQASLLAARLHLLFITGHQDAETPAILALAQARRNDPGFEALQAQLLRLDLLSGNLEPLRAAAATEPVADIRLSLQGAVAFLESRNDDALSHYREALKLRRKRLGRRKLLLENEHSVLFVMALLRANSATLHAEIQSAIDTMPADAADRDRGLLAMQAMLWLAQGMQAKAHALVSALQEPAEANPFAAACIALAAHAVDPALSRRNRSDLAAKFEALRETMPLLARIHAEILATASEHPGPYVAWLRERTLVRFTDLLQTQPPWQLALESLDLLLSATADPDAAKTPNKTKRLVWFLDPDSQQVIAAEQSTKGRNGWTDGRPVPMKRLQEQDPTRLDYLTPQDRTVLRTIRRDPNRWYDTNALDFDYNRAVVALVGHPLVFHAAQRAQPIELVAYPLELLVTERNGAYRVALSHTAEAATVFLEAETPTRYRVVEFTRKMLAVQDILGPNGLTIPASAREQVIALVRRDNPTLPVRAELADIAAAGIDAKPAPVVQLVPFESGLKLSLLVRPFGAGGPAYVAGLGGRSVLATIDGQQLRANRDLQRELADRAALVAACPTIRDRAGADTHELVVEDLEGSLELLLELRAYANPVAIEWPEGRTMRVSPMQPGQLKLRVAQERDWFTIDGSVTLDEAEVLEMRFLLERLDQTHGRFVALGDGRFVALTRQLQAHLQRLAAVSEPHKKGRRVHALAAPALEAVLEDAGAAKTDAAWKQHIARIRSAEGWTPVLPPTLAAELRDYQVDGFVWLSRLARWGAGACLADDMGLGKTVQALAVMLDRADQGPCLVVAPTSVCPNWVAETARFAPTLRVHRLAAAGETAALVAALGPHDVLVCSYGLLQLAAAELAAVAWQMVVLDEAQAIKNADTKRAQAVQGLQAGFRLALTGTPVENYLDELWSLFSFVNPAMLGSRDGFQKRFARPIERDKDPHARQALRALIRPFLLRRTKAAVLSELPPRTEQTLTVEMGDTERAFYEALRQQALERIAALDAPAGNRKIQILAEITRLRRACCNPALIDAAAAIPSGKLAAFLDLVDELLRNRHRALVFSQFTGHLALIRSALDARGVRYLYLDGSTPANERERLVAAFQAGNADLFLISLRAGGTGLNLTAADYVVHLDPWWNPAVEDQASDRAHRIGQDRAVTIYRLIMQDSIEQQILSLHRDKRDLATDLLEGSETTARLSEEALLELIRG